VLVRAARGRRGAAGVTPYHPCARGARLTRVAQLLALTFALAFATGACERASGSAAKSAAQSAANFDLTWKLDPQPARVGPATLVVTLRDGHEPVRGATVRIEGHMTHPGMAPLLTRASERAPGDYGAPIHLTMAGDWVLLVHAETPDGRRLERRIDLIRVRPAS
jgi:hypothetical protein